MLLKLQRTAKVNHSIRKLESYLKILKSAHKDFVEKIERYAVGDREEVNWIIKGVIPSWRMFRDRLVKSCLGRTILSLN